jgi:diaminopimelate decarboxylase
MKNYFTEQTGFFGTQTPAQLIEKYGSPLYVYNESILRERCRDMAGLVKYPGFKSNYSIKANSNLEILKIAREEGLHADAMSPGEIYILKMAGYKPEEMLFVCNNVSAEEMRYAVDNDVLVSCDSLSQLETFGRNFPGHKVAVRFNPGVGAGHHEKVVTGGKNTKFGVNADLIEEVKSILARYELTLAGINQHIGSLFMEPTPYIEGVTSLLRIAEQFEGLDFVDMGGGFGIPYHKQDGQLRLALEETSRKLTALIEEWTAKYFLLHGKNVTIKMEPGRYIVAECGVLLGNVYSIKQNSGKTFVGTDLGFNVLARPIMYDSHHDIEVYRNGSLVKDTSTEGSKGNSETVTVVGNICESGDIIAKDRSLPRIEEGDLLGVMDAGAYGYAMSSNYNNRLRPAEVLICRDGSARLIRRRDTLEDIVRNFSLINE